MQSENCSPSQARPHVLLWRGEFWGRGRAVGSSPHPGVGLNSGVPCSSSGMAGRAVNKPAGMDCLVVRTR